MFEVACTDVRSPLHSLGLTGYGGRRHTLGTVASRCMNMRRYIFEQDGERNPLVGSDSFLNMVAIGIVR
jgi:hypothetical protein